MKLLRETTGIVEKRSSFIFLSREQFELWGFQVYNIRRAFSLEPVSFKAISSKGKCMYINIIELIVQHCQVLFSISLKIWTCVVVVLLNIPFHTTHILFIVQVGKVFSRTGRTRQESCVWTSWKLQEKKCLLDKAHYSCCYFSPYTIFAAYHQCSPDLTL